MRTILSSTVFALLVAFAAAAGTPARAQAAEVAELSARQWREDLRFMAEEMEQRHTNLFHTVSREDFFAAVAELDRDIPDLDRNQIIVRMMQIAALVGDGHTRIDPRKDASFGFPSLPLKLYLFDDGLFVRAAAPEYASLVGARIEAIGGVPVSDAISRASTLVSRDNEMGQKLFIPLYLNMPDILQALGLADSRDEAHFTLSRDGKPWAARIPVGAVEPLWPPDTDVSLTTPEGWTDSFRIGAPPLWLAAPLDYHRLVELPEHGMLYAQLNMVTNENGQSLSEFGSRIRAAAQAMSARAIILDLRLNLGGNGNLRNGFARELIRAEDEDTRLFVLTSRGTFSASQFILDDLDRLTDAVFIGEPASSKPSAYGDSYRAPMPNSGISVRTSLLWWQAGQNRDPWTWVDIAAPLTFSDYEAGRDPALEAALNYLPPVPLAEKLVTAMTVEGGDGVYAMLESFQSDPAHRYADVVREILAAAETVYMSGEKELGFLAAKFASERFPAYSDAANLHAHFAEGIGLYTAARASAERVLALDPNNRFARALLDRILSADTSSSDAVD